MKLNYSASQYVCYSFEMTIAINQQYILCDNLKKTLD